MKVWTKALSYMLIMGLILAIPAALAEAAQSEEGQAGNSFAQQRILNQQEALGVEVNTSVKAQDITGRCKIRTSEGDTGRLTNGRVSTGWSYTKTGAWIGIKLPDGVVPGAIRFEFRFEPTGYELIEYDVNQNPLRTRTLNDYFPSIYSMFALLPETKLIQLKMTEKDQVVVNLKLYSEGVLPNDVQTWLPPVEKADMLVFSTHQDDEVIFLGGTIPYSDVVCSRPTQTVYMTNCSRNRRREALECLWVMGSRHYPEFINLTDKRVHTIDEGIRLWNGKDNILKEMVARIRRYKPEVIVTQDFNGEYGHNQHKIMARAMPYAIEAAADPTRYPESYQQYGAWQVKKLYIHLYKENEIRMDWLTPQPACGGLTLLKVAQNGMAKHASQINYYSVKNGGPYDNARFGLYMTTVGEDVNKNDFFENIPQDASAQYLADVAAGLIQAVPVAAAYGGAAPEGAAADEDATLDAPSGDYDSEDGAEMGLDFIPVDEDSEGGAEASLDFIPVDGDSEIATDAAEAAGDADAEGTAQTAVGDAPGAGGMPDADEPADSGEGLAAGEASAADAASGERGGGPGLAIALTGAALAAAGGGAWVFLRQRSRLRRGRAKHAGRTGRQPGKPASGAGARAKGGRARPIEKDGPQNNQN